MSEENAPKVGDHVPHYHTPVDDSPEAKAAARVQDLARFQMDTNVTIDNSAHSTFHQANVGRPGAYGNTYAKTNGVTTSPRIPYHDNVWAALKSQHPYLDSADVEVMMTYVYGGLSPAEASVNNYEAYDRGRFEELMGMSQIEAEAFTGAHPFIDYEDEEEEG